MILFLILPKFTTLLIIEPSTITRRIVQGEYRLYPLFAQLFPSEEVTSMNFHTRLGTRAFCLQLFIELDTTDPRD
jgi:hypothetical protein